MKFKVLNTLILASTLNSLPAVAQSFSEYCPVTGQWEYQSREDFMYSPNIGFSEGGPPYRTTVEIYEAEDGRLTVSGFYNMSQGNGRGRREINQIEVEMPLVSGRARILGSISGDNETISGSVILSENTHDSRATVSFEMTRQTECVEVSRESPSIAPDENVLSNAEAERVLNELRERSRREGWTFEIADSRIFRFPTETVAATKFPDNFVPLLFDIINILDYLTRNNRLPSNPSPAPPIPNRLSPGQVPSHFDAREWNVVPPIRFQGNCGSCWAFASLASYEIAYSALFRQSDDLDFSEQQLIDCTLGTFGGCEGGFVSEDNSDYMSIRENAGLASERVYPYMGEEGQCRLPRRATLDSSMIYQPGAFRFVSQDNPTSPETTDAIKAAVLSYGSAWVGMYADSDRILQAYNGGIFGEQACDNEARPNHAVNVVGWNDSQGYWIVRNSWGQDWGEDGYIRIEYGCNSIGDVVAVPKTLSMLNCSNLSCQTISASTPPWIQSSDFPSPRTPQPVPPVNIEPSMPNSNDLPYRDW